MEVVQEKLCVRAQKEQLAELRESLRRVCGQHNIRPNTTRRVVLAIDEAASNVMEHSGAPEGTTVEVCLAISDDSIVVNICDEGQEFDPTKADKSLPRGHPRSKRGFGLYLIHLITDEVAYCRTEDGKNFLTMTIDSR